MTSDTDDLPIGMMGQPPHLIARYRELIASGQSPRIAEICALRIPPGGKTDTSHFAGMGLGHLASVLGQNHVDQLVAKARAAGISVGPNSIYNGSLADKRGAADPGAWLLVGDGQAKFKNVARSRGMATADSDEVQFGESAQRVEEAAKWEQAYDKRKTEKLQLKKEMMDRQKKLGIEPAKKIIQPQA
jgi:hypothetical protein